MVASLVGDTRALLVFVVLEEAEAWVLGVGDAQGVIVEDRHWVGVEVWVGEVVAGREEGLRTGVEVPVEVTEGGERQQWPNDRAVLALPPAAVDAAAAAAAAAAVVPVH